jgi:hypothetical protein
VIGWSLYCKISWESTDNNNGEDLPAYNLDWFQNLINSSYICEKSKTYCIHKQRHLWVSTKLPSWIRKREMRVKFCLSAASERSMKNQHFWFWQTWLNMYDFMRTSVPYRQTQVITTFIHVGNYKTTLESLRCWESTEQKCTKRKHCYCEWANLDLQNKKTQQVFIFIQPRFCASLLAPFC